MMADIPPPPPLVRAAGSPPRKVGSHWLFRADDHAAKDPGVDHCSIRFPQAGSILPLGARWLHKFQVSPSDKTLFRGRRKIVPLALCHQRGSFLRSFLQTPSFLRGRHWALGSSLHQLLARGRG